METKKKLRKDLDFLYNELGAISLRIAALEKKEKEQTDTISGNEAAKMLGWQSGYVSSTWLDKVGIKYSKGDNGCLKISHKAIVDYLTTREKTNED